MEKVLIFANPIAGRGKGRRVAARIERRLRDSGLAVRLYFEPAASIPDELLREARAAISIGGDGTLRAVAERLLNACGDRTPPLLVIPFGTANLMGRHLGLNWDDRNIDQQVLDAILHGSTRSVDAANANGRLFLLMAGVGIDGYIIHALERLRGGPISIASYVLPSALALMNYSYPKLCIEADGRRVFGPTGGVAFVGNAREYGTYFPILPHARTDDGLLDLCAIPCRSRAEAAQMFLYTASGDHLHAEGVVYLKVRHVRIDSDEPVAVQIDGEAAGFTPLTIDLLPTKVRFIVPAPP